MSTINMNFTDGAFTITDDAAHSETLALSEGDFSLTYDAQDGHEITVSQTRGEVSGVRKAARRLGSLSCTAKLADPGANFQTLAAGLTAGFVSVVADIGDANGVDWDFSFDLGAQARSYYGEDAIFGEISVTEADPGTISFSAELLGPMYSSDSTNGIKTLVSSR